MIVLTDIGAEHDLDALLECITAYFHLYVSDSSPIKSTVAADLVEASWPGYAPVKVATWTDAVASGLCAVSIADPIIWMLSSPITPVNVYGYYVTDGLSGPLCWAERRGAGPIVMQNAGDRCEVLPRFTLRTDPEPC